MRITFIEIKDQASQTLTAIKKKHLQSLSVAEDFIVRGFLEELIETGVITITKSCKDHWMNEKVGVSPFRAEIISQICELINILDQVNLSEKHVSKLLKDLETETRECIQELYGSRVKRKRLQEIEKRKREMAQTQTESAMDIILDEDITKEPKKSSKTSQKDKKTRYVSGRDPKRNASRSR